MNLPDDTIAAIASPPGEGGVGIIRLSGSNAARIAGDLFRRGRRGGRLAPERLESHRLYYGRIVDPEDERAIDEVLLALMRAPRSYTREDVVEISCHGGPGPLQAVLALALTAGARPAGPGEFTLRAFLNGRIDLSQAEAVMAVVSAQTPESLRLAVDELRGALSARLAPARRLLLESLAYLDASADFPEDEVPPFDVGPALSRAERALEALVADARFGLLYREGVQIAIVGRPNVGKSSLMNALLRAERAIVTEIAGTTRDIISETVAIHGIPATLLDTAGITETADLVERLGIDRSRRALIGSALALLVLDGSRPATDEDRVVAGLLRERLSRDGAGKLVVVLNKADLQPDHDHAELLGHFPGAPVVRLSSVTGQGIAELERALHERLAPAAGEAREPALVTLRQQQALDRALASVRAALRALGQVPLDLVAVDVRAALLAVGEITGEQVSESVLDEIFSRFCIGK